MNRAAAPTWLAWCLALAVVAGAAWWHVQSVDRPYGADLGDRISLAYAGASLNAWRASSPLDHELHWCLFHDPEFPAVQRPYVHHPPLALSFFYGADRAFGGGWRAWRRGAAIWWGLSIASLLLLGIGRMHAWGTATLLALAAASPASIHHGDLMCPPIFAWPGMCVAAAASWRWISSGSRGWAAVTVAGTMIASLSDANAWALFPVLGMAALCAKPRSWTQRRRLFGTLLVAGIATVWVLHDWALFAAGSPTTLSVQWAELRSVVADVPAWGAWLRAVLGHTQALFGLPFLIVAGIGCFFAPWCRARAIAYFAATMTVCAILSMAAFRARTFDHPFWVSLLSPGLAAFATLAILQLLAVLRASATLRRLGAPAAVLVVLGLSLWNFHLGRAQERQQMNGRDRLWAAEIDRAFGPRDLVVGTEYSLAAVRAHATTTIFPMVRSRAQLDQALALYGRDRLAALDRLVLLIPGGLARVALDPDLAWIVDLPRVAQTERDLPAPMPLGVFEIDRSRL